MADHMELVAEIPVVDKMNVSDRLKHAKKRRANQMKKYHHYEKQIEKQIEKENAKKRKLGQNMPKKPKRKKKLSVNFVNSVKILEAASRNDTEEVRSLLLQGVDPNLTNEDGLTALHQCCIDDNEEMLKLLLEFGADVNARDSELWTPLHAAATCGNIRLCELLINNGADVMIVNVDGNMPYDICDDEETLDFVESEMAKRGITQEQIDETRLATEKKMLSDLKNMKDEGYLHYQDHNGVSFLHMAAANGYFEVAEFLLEHNMSVNVRDDDSWQPIHAAACWGQPMMLELLVKHGADIDAKVKNSETPFDICEDPDIKQKILDMKDELENKRAKKLTDSVKKARINTRSLIGTSSLYNSNSSLSEKMPSASIRRSSMRGDRSPLFMKEAKEEAAHFGRRPTLAEGDEEEDYLATNIDDVHLIIGPICGLETQDDQSFQLQNDEKSDHEHHNSKQSLDKPVPPTDTAVSKKGEQVENKPDSKVRKEKGPAPCIPVENENEYSQESLLRPDPARSELRYQSTVPSGTLADLKKQRMEKYVNQRYKENMDTEVQNMFLQTVISDRSPDVKENSQNGHNKSSAPNSRTIPISNGGQPPLRKFSVSSSIQVIGGDDDGKQRCCVIM